MKLIFNTGADGQRDQCFFQMSKYDWSESTGLFREIISPGDEQQWAKKCNEAIKHLETQDDPKECQDASSSSQPSSGINVKRKVSSIVQQLAPGKKKCGEENLAEAKELQYQRRTAECEVDGQFYVPVDKIELPPPDRMIRKVDEIFLAQLKANMESNPNGSYEPLYLLAKDVDATGNFSKSCIDRYNYEVLGGTHNLLATKQLLEEHPDSTAYKGRYARIFVGLTNVEALWLASRHNKTGSFRHEMTFQDEVEVARGQLELISERNEDGNLVSSPQWRNSCSHILGKTKKNLADVLLVAQLPEVGYQAFLEICTKYTKGLLKDQRAMAKDLKEKPRFKASYIKCLYGVEVQDRIDLLSQVADQSISLDDLKSLCKELKTLQPVQKVISSFLGCKWETLTTQLGEKVKVEQLRKFKGKDETNLLFRQYLEYLQKSMAGERDMELPTVVSPNTFVTDQGTKGIVKICQDPLGLQQGSYGQEKGFSLALYRLAVVPLQDDDVTTYPRSLLDLMDRVNFGVRNIFNIAIIGDIEQLMKIKEWIEENRGMCELGYICVEGIKPPGVLGMIKAVEGFLVYHAALGQRVLQDHFNFNHTNNFMVVGLKRQDNEICSRLVEMFSRPGDWILDVNIKAVAGAASALENGRNALCLVTEDEEDIAKTILRELCIK